jgi:sulfate permease, SulP family
MSRPAEPEQGSRLGRFVPGLWRLKQYRAGQLPGDLAAGVTLGVVMIPVGLAFGSLAGMPMAGLYASVFPIIAYALFGGAKLLVVNPDAAMSALIAASVAPLAVGGGDLAFAQMIGVLGLLMAVICAVGALCRVGFIADLLAKPVIVGFMHGTAAVIVIGQIPKALGIRIDSDATWRQVIEIMQEADGANLVDLTIALVSFAVILAFRRWWPRIPGQILVLVAAPLFVVALGLEGRGVETIGRVPAGLPGFQVPGISLDLVRQLLPIALMGSLLAFSDMMVLARAFAARHRTKVDANQELMALGLANAASAVTQGLPVSGSGSRTAVAESAGGQGPVCLLAASATVLVILAFFTPLLRPLPLAALAGILFAAAWNLCDFREFRRLWNFRGVGLLVALLTMGGVIVFGMLAGILIGVTLCILLLLRHLSLPYDAVLGRLSGSSEFRDLSRNPEAQAIPGVLVYRFSGPLFFANATRFSAQVERQVLRQGAAVHHVVVDASGITGIDITAIEALITLGASLGRRNIGLTMAEAIGPLREDLELGGALPALGGRIFPTLDEAVRTASGARA